MTSRRPRYLVRFTVISHADPNVVATQNFGFWYDRRRAEDWATQHVLLLFAHPDADKVRVSWHVEVLQAVD